MENFDRKRNKTKNKAVNAQKLSALLLFCLCVLCSSGCGRMLDFLEKTETETEKISEIEKIPQGEAGESASVQKEDFSGYSGRQEYLNIEENQVEEGTAKLSLSDLDRKREEIGLSQADIAGLQEAQSGNYYFEQLSGQEKILYVECYQILTMQEEEILLSTAKAEILPRVYQCVINDHPELFYLNGYTYTQYTRGGEVQYITFSGRYLYDKQEVARRQKAIDIVVEEKTGRLHGGDEYETVKRVYEDLILSTDYSMESPDNQNICSVFLDGKSVCNGYAKAAQYLLNYLGIPCIIVNGKAGGSSHAWNIVEIDGAYYQMDATWGDPSYYSEEAGEKTDAPEIDYSYFCVTTAEIAQNHSADSEFAFPVCTATAANYFVREGRYLQGYEKERIRNIFETAKTAQERSVCIKASDRAAYQEIYHKLIDEQEIFDYFGDYQADGEYKIAYSGNEEIYTIHFWY